MKKSRIVSETLPIKILSTYKANQPFIMTCDVDETIKICEDFNNRINSYIDIAENTGYTYLIREFDDAQQFLGETVEELENGILLTLKKRNEIRNTIKHTLKITFNFEC
jgi:hypothetical protein